MTPWTNPPKGSWLGGGRSSPTPTECIRILRAYGVPEHIVGHSRVVARLARRLTGELAQVCRGGAYDPSKVEAGALLHDIAKKPEERRIDDHAREGGRILRSLGLPEIAVLVERHINPGDREPSAPVGEDEVLAYCDKRVMHESIVSLKDRYADLLERYGSTDRSLRHRIARTAGVMDAVERRIFTGLPFAPEDMAGW